MFVLIFKFHKIDMSTLDDVIHKFIQNRLTYKLNTCGMLQLKDVITVLCKLIDRDLEDIDARKCGEQDCDLIKALEDCRPDNFDKNEPGFDWATHCPEILAARENHCAAEVFKILFGSPPK